jgi:hypothetical protein
MSEPERRKPRRAEILREIEERRRRQDQACERWQAGRRARAKQRRKP